eukprot:20507-Heterococcus_DN1.PRE.1
MPIAFKHVLLAQQDDDENDDDEYEDEEELAEEQDAATAAAATAAVNALAHQQQPDPALLQAPLAMASAQEEALQSVVEGDEQAFKRQRVEAQEPSAVQMSAGVSEQPQVSSRSHSSTAAYSIGQNGHAAAAPASLTGYSVAVKLLGQLYEDFWHQYHRRLRPLLLLILDACLITSLLLLANYLP